MTEEHRWLEAAALAGSHLVSKHFHGEQGADLGASHQTGSTVLIGALTPLFGRLDTDWLEKGSRPGRSRKQSLRRSMRSGSR